MNSRSLIVILLTLGLLGLLSSFLVMGGSFADGFNSLKDGQDVSCTVVVYAPATGSNLAISGQPSCHKIDSCFTSPFKSLSLVGIKGDIGLWQSGVLYASQAVDQWRLTSETYTINACIPQEASAVRIGIITENGGVVNDQPITIT